MENCFKASFAKETEHLEKSDEVSELSELPANANYIYLSNVFTWNSIYHVHSFH